jgi:hypothetical protein
MGGPDKTGGSAMTATSVFEGQLYSNRSTYAVFESPSNFHDFMASHSWNLVEVYQLKRAARPHLVVTPSNACNFVTLAVRYSGYAAKGELMALKCLKSALNGESL